jgi:hypothetical protein
VQPIGGSEVLNSAIRAWRVTISPDPEIFCRFLPAIGRDLVADLGTFVEGAEPGPLNRGDVHKDVLATAIRLDESYPLVALNHFTVPVAMFAFLSFETKANASPKYNASQSALYKH